MDSLSPTSDLVANPSQSIVLFLSFNGLASSYAGEFRRQWFSAARHQSPRLGMLVTHRPLGFGQKAKRFPKSHSLQMNVVALLEESDGHASTGHMTVGIVNSRPNYFGFRFDPDDLPDEFRNPKRWREYLFENSVPGHIVDETNYVAALTLNSARRFLRKEWAAIRESSDFLPHQNRWSYFAFYSFNPDDFPNCYNCVSWATRVITDLVPESLIPVRNGRVKLMAAQLQAIPLSRRAISKTGDDPEP